MARPTGRGKAEVRTSPPSLLLFNFDIDGDGLKEDHKTFLREQAIPQLRAGSGVSVIGLADRLGSAGHNEELSKKRVARTLEFLLQEVPDLKLDQVSGFGEAAAKREGEADNTASERFRAVLLFLSVAPTKSKVVTVTAKSFIAFIGGNVGVMPGIALIPLPPSPVPIPVPRQKLLNVLASATDLQFNENPLNPAKDKHYRLFSSVKFSLVFEGGKILAAVPLMDTDVGKEGPIQPPPLIVSPVTVSPRGSSFVTFSWFGKGLPDPLVEPGFQAVRSRTSVFIWHIVEGKIDVSSGVPVTTVSIRGSQFPSHRVFVDNTFIPPQQPQGPFSNLWNPDPIDNTKVR